MANLTITVDDAVLRRARARAARRGASINELLSDYLRHYAGADRSAQAIGAFLELAALADAGSGAGGSTWKRDELYDRTNLASSPSRGDSAPLADGGQDVEDRLD